MLLQRGKSWAAELRNRLYGRCELRRLSNGTNITSVRNVRCIALTRNVTAYMVSGGMHPTTNSQLHTCALRTHGFGHLAIALHGYCCSQPSIRSPGCPAHRGDDGKSTVKKYKIEFTLKQTAKRFKIVAGNFTGNRSRLRIEGCERLCFTTSTFHPLLTTWPVRWGRTDQAVESGSLRSMPACTARTKRVAVACSKCGRTRFSKVAAGGDGVHGVAQRVSQIGCMRTNEHWHTV